MGYSKLPSPFNWKFASHSIEDWQKAGALRDCASPCRNSLHYQCLSGRSLIP